MYQLKRIRERDGFIELDPIGPKFSTARSFMGYVQRVVRFDEYNEYQVIVESGEPNEYGLPEIEMILLVDFLG